MAIRYFAYPVDADDIEQARTDPYPRLGTDPQLDASGPEAERPDMLYLDTCWRLMQRLLLTRPGYPTRPAAHLVAGDVVMTEQGWIPHVEVLTPSQVAEVARDLDTVTDADISAMPAWTRHPDRPADDLGHVAQYVKAAREFTARQAAAGRGLIYFIG
jgi:hypothetical protein